MQLIDNDELTIAEMLCVTFLCQHHGKTFRRGDEKFRAVFPEFFSIGRTCVSGSEMDAPFFFHRHAGDRAAQIFFNVVGERAQR